MSDSIISFFYWANCSGHSPKWEMWVNCSGCLPKLSEWANRPFFWANCSFAQYSLIFSQKTSDSLRKPMSEFPTLTAQCYGSRSAYCKSGTFSWIRIRNNNSAKKKRQINKMLFPNLGLSTCLFVQFFFI